MSTEESLFQRIANKLRGPRGWPICPEGKETFWKNNHHKWLFKGLTLGEFLVNVQLTVHTRTINEAEYLKAPLFTETEYDDFVASFRQTFLNWMHETRRDFYMDQLSGHGWIIRITEDGNIVDEINCSDTTKAFKNIHFTKYGCNAELILCDVLMKDEKLIRENYIIMDAAIKQSLESLLLTRKIEEAWNIVLLNTWARLERAWNKEMTISSNRSYKGKWIEVQTENQGNEVVLRWKFKEDCESARFHVRGFRREGSFALTPDDQSQGALIVDRWGADWKGERLELGKTYFYTFVVYYLHDKANKNESAQENEQERLRFEVMTSPKAAMDDFEARLALWIKKFETLKSPAPDPKKEKINRAFEELSSFVEFDESMTQMEKDLIKRIESKGYSAKEREDKIERLKLAVEALCMERI